MRRFRAIVVCLPVSGARRGSGSGVFPDQRGFRVVMRGGGGTWQAVINARCLSVGSVDCTTVPAGPVRVTAASRDMCVAMQSHVSPVRSSTTLVSSSASQQISTWAVIRGSRRWNAGRSRRPVFISRNPCSAFNRFLLPTAISAGERCASEVGTTRKLLPGVERHSG